MKNILPTTRDWLLRGEQKARLTCTRQNLTGFLESTKNAEVIFMNRVEIWKSIFFTARL